MVPAQLVSAHTRIGKYLYYTYLSHQIVNLIAAHTTATPHTLTQYSSPMSTSPITLYYILDPMCSWCWGFSACFADFQNYLNVNTAAHTITWRYLMGGLAPDSDEPMPQSMQSTIQQHWHAVAKHTGAAFNFDFWSNCTARRSTWPACRAVIAAGLQNERALPAMIHGIQEAYYCHAQNPSDTSTLTAVAVALGLDQQQFLHDYQSAQVEQLFQAQRMQAQAFGISGFPAIVAEQGQRHSIISSGYTAIDTLRARYKQFSNS